MLNITGPRSITEQRQDEMHARVLREDAQKAADRAAQRAANPAGYAARQALRDEASRAARERNMAYVAAALQRQMQESQEDQEPEGYTEHKLVDAVTDAILVVRKRREAARSNQDDCDAIKSAFNPIFADVGLRLVRIHGFNRNTSYINNPRLR